MNEAQALVVLKNALRQLRMLESLEPAERIKEYRRWREVVIKVLKEVFVGETWKIMSFQVDSDVPWSWDSLWDSSFQNVLSKIEKLVQEMEVKVNRMVLEAKIKGTHPQVTAIEIVEGAEKAVDGWLSRQLGDEFKEVLEVFRKTYPDLRKEIEEVVDNWLGKHFGESMGILDQAYEDLYSGSTVQAWKNIAHTCRDALIAFANQVYQDTYLPEGVPAPKGDDVKNKLKYALRYKLKLQGETERYRVAVEKLVEDTWDFVVCVVHRRHATPEDAKLCVVHTYLAIWNVGRLFGATGS